MPLIFLFIGALFLIAAVRDTLEDKDGEKGLITLLAGDFSGPNSFIPWIAAIFTTGAIGYIPGLKPLSNALLVLLAIVILLSHKGFFAQLQAQLDATGTPQGTLGNPLGSIPSVPSIPSGGTHNWGSLILGSGN